MCALDCIHKFSAGRATHSVQCKGDRQSEEERERGRKRRRGGRQEEREGGKWNVPGKWKHCPVLSFNANCNQTEKAARAEAVAEKGKDGCLQLSWGSVFMLCRHTHTHTRTYTLIREVFAALLLPRRLPINAGVLSVIHQRFLRSFSPSSAASASPSRSLPSLFLSLSSSQTHPLPLFKFAFRCK